VSLANRWIAGMAVFLAVSLPWAGPAVSQNTVTFTFGGYLDQVDASLAGVFSVGDPFYGSVTYDLDAPDQLPDNPDYGIYYNVVAFSCVIGGTHQAQATTGSVDLPVGNVMDWIIDGGFSGDTAAGMTPQFVNIPLAENQSDPILVTDQMPGNPFPSMLDFGSAWFRIRYGPTYNENEVQGPITLDDAPAPVDRTTWGRIKALYAN
jgi:hypothetical protein